MKITNEQWQHLYRYSVLLCENTDDALELLEAAMNRLLLVKRTDKLEPEVYLRKVMRNLQYSRSSTHRLHLTLEESASEGALKSSTESHAYAFETLDALTITRHRLAEIWQKLSLEQKSILYSWAYLGKNPQHVAEDINMPIETLLEQISHLHEMLTAATSAIEIGAREIS